MKGNLTYKCPEGTFFLQQISEDKSQVTDTVGELVAPVVRDCTRCNVKLGASKLQPTDVIK